MLRLVAVAVLAASAFAQDHAAARTEAKIFTQGGRTLPYRSFAPKTERRLPLVLFLHGAGERGTDNERQLVHGVTDFVSASAQEKNPCFVLAPQCPRGVWWMDGGVYPLVIALLKQTIAKHRIDPDRVYITGLSMGGYATWHALGRDADLFAAAVPICGGGSKETAELLAKSQLAKFPIWVFHGDADRSVPLQKSKEMIAALQKAGNRPKFTVYKGVGHNSWSRAYADPKLHEWLFAQRRAKAVRDLRDGDRIVFFGDSITQAGARKNGYIRMIEVTLRETRPDLQVELVGAGISGNKVPNLQKRLERDVLSKKPSVVFLYIGINDVWHWNRNRGTKKPAFESGLRDLVAKITAAKADVILCTPSVIGEKTDGSNKFDPMLAEYSAISRRVASETGAQLLDLRKQFLAHLKAHNPDNKARGILTRDTVHLNSAGNRFVADRMLEALGVETAKRSPRQPAEKK